MRKVISKKIQRKAPEKSEKSKPIIHSLEKSILALNKPREKSEPMIHSLEKNIQALNKHQTISKTSEPLRAFADFKLSAHANR